GPMHGGAAGEALRRAGAALRLGERAVQLDGEGVRLEGGELLEGDAVVVAVPPEESARLLSEPDPGLGASPIVSVHLLLDRQLLRHPVAGLLGSPAHWLFDRGLLTGRPPAEGQYLTVVSSGAPELLAIRGRELVELIAGALAERLGPAELLWSRVSREPRATFAARPGTLRLRPGAETAWPNVARAGAWTQTGWPATMESAVASGRRAALLLAKMATKVAA
ncbi:MAG TPA: FAD-dependent oxidoreductase, partial [Gaiellaceae bacterium]